MVIETPNWPKDRVDAASINPPSASARPSARVRNFLGRSKVFSTIYPLQVRHDCVVIRLHSLPVPSFCGTRRKR